MRPHPRAKGNAYQRRLMIRRVLEEGWSVAAASEAAERLLAGDRPIPHRGGGDGDERREAKLMAERKLRERGSPIVSQALYEDHLARITAAAADHTYLTFHQAGVGLADRAWAALEGERTRGAAAGDPRPSDPPPTGH